MDHQSLQAICETCRRSFGELLIKGRFKCEHRPSLRALIASVEDGCPACAIIYHNFTYTGYHANQLDRKCVSLGRLSSQDKIRIFLSGAEAETVYGTDLSFYRKSEDVQPCLWPHPDDKDSLKVLRALNRFCLENHPECASADPGVPTRLLDLGSSGNISDIKLVTGAESLRHNEPYVTLSHCWGIVPPDAPWKLTKARNTAYHEEIPLEALPLTFRQAMECTRKLGQRFLWIDSLCIMQDSADDWAYEASRMATVYANSIYTLSSASSSSLEGCIPKRDHSKTVPVLIELDRHTKIYIVPSVPEETKLRPTIPVTGRAWCLQERELSKRIIQFTPYQWLWNCKTASTSERLIRALADDPKYFADRPHASLKYQGLSGQMAQKSRGDGVLKDNRDIIEWHRIRKPYEPWYQIVQNFTKCQITYPQDRLPAIAGMAHRQQQETPDVYLAGLWQNDIAWGLCWVSSVPLQARPHEYIGPSWSWICLNRDIRLHHPFPHLPDRSWISLISTQMIQAGPDSLGAVEEGSHIRLRGKLKSAKTYSTAEEMDTAEMEHPVTTIREDRRFIYFSDTQTSPPSLLSMDCTDDLKSCDEVMCLPVLDTYGLALLPYTSGGKSPAYRRVGFILALPLDVFDNVAEVEFDLY